MPLWLTLLVLALATGRITRLVGQDDFPPLFHAREWVIARYPDHTVRPAGQTPYENHWWLGELLVCPWCASGYVSGGLVGFVWWQHGLALPVLVWFSVWMIGAAIAAQYK